MSYQEYQKLCEEIARHNRLYFEEAKPEITDEAFDALVLKASELEKLHPEWVGENSPSLKMGEMPISGFKEVPHAVPMLSLEKAFTLDEVQAFIDRARKLLEGKPVAFTSEMKVDGLAISLLYEMGELMQALTRGDGKVGSDVTQNIKMISTIPSKLHGKHVPELLEVRGEVYLPKDAFQALNHEREIAGEPLWANPRNAAAGTLKLLDPNQVAARKGLTAAFYGISQMSEPKVHFQHDVVPFLHTLCFPVLEHDKHIYTTAEGLIESAEKIKAKREKLHFGIDGVVFKLDNLHDAEQLSATAKHPRSALAFKFSAEQAMSRVREITVQVGRTGVLTPVAELEPTLLAGSTISRATLHNEEEVARKDIRVGDRVIIEKGGDVIPKVVAVDFTARAHSSTPWRMPESCPSCGTKVVRDEVEVAVRCPNHNCPEQVIRSLTHFAGKDGLDIEGMGDKVVRQLYAKGFVKTPADILKLNSNEISQLEGFKEKSTNNLLTGIEKAKKTTLDRLILALGIRHVGTATAELIAKKVGSIEGLRNLSHAQMQQIHGIGEAVADSLVAYFQDPKNQQLLDSFISSGVTFEVLKVTESKISGLQIVLTGSLETMSRSEATKRIKERGGIVSESVSKKTDLVVAGADPGSKYEKAKKLGIKIIDEAEFIQITS